MNKQADQQPFDFKWQRRHIVVDHFNKTILIQVMWDNNGSLRYNEFMDIQAGNWREYLPQGLSNTDIEVRREMNALQSAGYIPRPMFFHGIENDQHAVLLLTDIKDPKLTQIPYA